MKKTIFIATIALVFFACAPKPIASEKTEMFEILKQSEYGGAEFKFFEIFDTSFIGRKWTLNYNVNFIVMILYFFLCDFLSKGVSLGKKIMNLEIEKKSSNYILQYRLCRTLLKCFFLFSILLPVTIIYFFVKNEVFYDKILNTNVVK